ncbi:hypothetical protein J2S53_003631 [Actinopolyspora lacussalsi]|nr:hypothetical protein [Actinopolyspora lacussalsi]
MTTEQVSGVAFSPSLGFVLAAVLTVLATRVFSWDTDNR